jgi:hypothetical protein
MSGTVRKKHPRKRRPKAKGQPMSKKVKLDEASVRARAEAYLGGKSLLGPDHVLLDRWLNDFAFSFALWANASDEEKGEGGLGEEWKEMVAEWFDAFGNAKVTPDEFVAYMTKSVV